MLNGLRVKHFPLLLWNLLIASSSSENMKGIRSDERITASVLEKIIKNYIENNQLINDKPRSEEIIILSEVENAIKLKVNELKPMLQDTDHNDNTINNLNRKNKGEYHKTTITDLEPVNNRKTDTKSASKETIQLKDTLQETIEYYKQFKQNMTTLLDVINPISTKNMMTKTMDEMLDTLIERQCKWKSVDTVMRELIESQKSWETLTGLEFIDRTRGGKPRENVNNLQRFSSNLLLSMWDVLDKHKLRCYMSRKEDPDFEPGPLTIAPAYPSARIQSFDKTFDRDDKDKHQCNSFIICSDELRYFLKITYNYLNDTVVSTFSNYADTYNNTESIKVLVNSVLVNLIKSAQTKVNEVFLTELGHFSLDKNKNKAANIEHINNFITATTGQTKSNLSQFVDDKLTSPEIDFFTRIKDDLILNLRIDTDNLSQQFADKMCGYFVLCNGVNPDRPRRFNKPQAYNPEGVHLIQESFNDDLKDSLLRFGEKRLNSWQGDKSDRFGKSMRDAIDRQKYSDVNVARTTISSIAMTDGVVSSENGMVYQFF